MTYTVIVAREEDGRYTLTVPALDGLATFGDTLPEGLRMVEDAIGIYVEALVADGKPIPTDTPQVLVDMAETNEVFVYKLTLREPVPVG